MRRLLASAFVTVGLLAATAAPAFGAGLRDHADCNSDDPDRNIAGCTRIVEDRSESARTRAIAYVARGLAWHDKGKLDRAIADFTAAIRLDPQDALAYNNRGQALRETGDVDRAIADLTEAIRINPTPTVDQAGRTHINIHANRAIAWQAKGDFDRAIADYTAAIRLDPEDADAYFHRGQVLISKHDFDRAIADLDATIRLDSSRAYAYHLRGVARFQLYTVAGDWIEQEDLDRAIADFTQAIRLDAKIAVAYYARGLAWNIDGKRDRAIADLTAAVRLDPADAHMAAALKQLKP